MKAFSLVLLALCILPAPLLAQKPVPPKHLRFIPLGEQPPWVEGELKKEGIRQRKPVPQGALPPNPMAVLSGENALPFRLDFLTFTDLLTLDGKTPKLQIQAGKPGAAQNWLAHPMPTAPLSLGVVYCDPQAMNWNNPKMLLLDDSPTAFPHGKIRLVNVSDRLVIFQLENDTQPRGLRPGTFTIKDLKPGNPRVRLGYLNEAGEPQWPTNNKIKVLPKERLHVFFYKPQDADALHPVKIHFVPETLPQLPKPPKKAGKPGN